MAYLWPGNHCRPISIDGAILQQRVRRLLLVGGLLLVTVGSGCMPTSSGYSLSSASWAYAESELFRELSVTNVVYPLVSPRLPVPTVPHNSVRNEPDYTTVVYVVVCVGSRPLTQRCLGGLVAATQRWVGRMVGDLVGLSLPTPGGVN